jgi:hypothetical protein
MNMTMDLTNLDFNTVDGVKSNQGKKLKAEINHEHTYAIEMATKAFGDFIKDLKTFQVVHNGVAYTTD